MVKTDSGSRAYTVMVPRTVTVASDQSINRIVTMSALAGYTHLFLLVLFRRKFFIPVLPDVHMEEVAVSDRQP